PDTMLVDMIRISNNCLMLDPSHPHAEVYTSAGVKVAEIPEGLSTPLYLDKGLYIIRIGHSSTKIMI
ncbi:MAG: hypothetical protein K2I48_08810, partial [Muribaculaceae bacterium]|nr:hypothetical protein [Muribaculaceae bacterium]